MTAPPKRDNQNFLDSFGAGLSDSAKDVANGVSLIAQGQVSRGIESAVQGNMGLATAGTSNLLFSGPAAAKKKGEITADLAAQTLATNTADQAAAAEADRMNKVKTRLAEEIRLRQKTPGRQQTLLTSQVTPSATNTNSLLTTAATGSKR